MSEAIKQQHKVVVQNTPVENIVVGDLVVFDPVVGVEKVVSLEHRALESPIKRDGWSDMIDFYIIKTTTRALDGSDNSYPRWLLRSANEPVLIYAQDGFHD